MNLEDKPPPYSEVVNTGYASSAPGAPSAPVMTAPGPLGSSFYPPLNHNAGGPHSFGGPQPVAPSPVRPMHTTNYGSVTLVHRAPEHSVIIVGGCPACRIGVLEDDYSCLGIFCAVFFFPLGILCCLATRQRRCPNCGAIFG